MVIAGEPVFEATQVRGYNGGGVVATYEEPRVDRGGGPLAVSANQSASWQEDLGQDFSAAEVFREFSERLALWQEDRTPGQIRPTHSAVVAVSYEDPMVDRIRWPLAPSTKQIASWQEDPGPTFIAAEMFRTVNSSQPCGRRTRRQHASAPRK